MQQTIHKPARGFALVIVVVCSVAMVAIALALVFTAGANRLVSVKGSSIDQSETIALAGMERAVAYAERVAEVERDFDLLLDPDLAVRCVSSVTSQDSPQNMSPTSKVGLPRFSDGVVGNYEGRNYRVVPFNNGAYLIRYDDDADDAEANIRLAPFTSNRPNDGCLEGPDFTEGNNPFRDRNRSVWISVVGIYPGVDPARARHRTTLRRFHISTQPLPGVAVYVEHDLKPKQMTFCSALGDVGAGHDIDFDDVRVCGTPTAGHNINKSSSDPFPLCTSAPAECAPTSTPVQNATLPTFAQLATAMTRSDAKPNSGAWFRQGAQAGCNLYGKDGLLGGLYYWDTHAAGCANGPGFDASGNPKTVPDPPNLVADLVAGAGTVTAAWAADAGHCWTPLFVSTGADVIVDVLGWSNVSAVVAPRGWKPVSGSEVAPTNPLLGATLKQPDWATCKVHWPRKAPLVTEERGCTACDGSTLAIRFNANRIVVDGSAPLAMPAVSFRYKGDFSTGGNYVAPAAIPLNDDLDAWLPMSLLIEGKLQGGGNDDFAVGFGPGVLAPSLVVEGDVDLNGNASVHAAGSVVVHHDVKMNGNSKWRSFGVVLVGHDFDAGGSSSVFVDYDEDVVGAAKAVPAAATTSRTIR